jgi:S-DNA-T family DNA segregation ATPase FtsK/SpoIIIE
VQQQRVASFDPAVDGHLLVVGSGRSGRSQLLRTLAAAVAERCSTADVHLYGLDCGNGALLALQDLPHCGAVVTRTQVERVARLLGRLTAEVERRQALLAERGHADVTEQRRSAPPGERLPHLVLLLDRWEGFTSSVGDVDGGRLTDTVLLLLREGASAGVSLVVTGDRSLASGRIASLTDNTLVLRLADRGDYALCGLNPRQLPDEIPPGRGFSSGTGIETQVALLSTDDSGQGQAAVLAELAKSAHVRDALVPRSARPFRVDVLPSRLSFDQAWEMRPDRAGPRFALVGVGGDELTAAGPDFALSGPAFVVGGPGRSGKSSLLAVMARSLLRAGTPVVLGAPRPSPLRELAGEPGVLAVVTDAAEPAATWQEAVAAADGAPVVLLLDDAEVLRDCPAAELFRDVVKGMAGPGLSLVLGGNAEGICTGLSGWQVEAKKSRQGVLLSPQGGSDGELIGLRLPRSAVGQPVQPGRGLLHLGDSTLLSVAVPAL